MGKRCVRYLLGLLLCCPGYPGVEYKCWELRGTTVHLAVCDLRDATVSIEFARGTNPYRGLWRAEGFTSFLSRIRPLAAINGTYYNPATHMPVSAILIGRELIVDGLSHSFVGIYQNGAAVHYTSQQWGRYAPWPCDVKMGLATGPILVQHGRLHKNRHDEGYKTPGIWGVARRSAIGVTRAGKLVLMATNDGTGLNRWAVMSYDAGLTDSLNLDGGGSVAFYAGGRIRCWPGRGLPGLIVVR